MRVFITSGKPSQASPYTPFFPVFLAVFLFVFITLVPAALAADTVELFGINIEEFETGTRLSFLASEPLLYIESKLSDPDRLVLDLIGRKIYTRERSLIPIKSNAVNRVENTFYSNIENELGRRIDQITIVLTGDNPYRIHKDSNIVRVDISNTPQQQFPSDRHADTVFAEVPALSQQMAKASPHDTDYQTPEATFQGSLSPGLSALPTKKQSHDTVAVHSDEVLFKYDVQDLTPADIADPELRELLFPDGATDAAFEEAAIVQAAIRAEIIQPINFQNVIEQFNGPEYPELFDGFVLGKDKPLDLNACIAIALDNYRPVQIAKEEVKLAKMRLIEAKRAFYPVAVVKSEVTEAEVSGGLADRRSRRLRLEFQQPLFRGGELKNAYDQAKINVELASKRLSKTKADIAFEVEKAFYTFAASKLKRAQQEDLIAEITELVQLIKKRHEFGLSRQLDILTAESQVRELQRELISTTDEVSLFGLALQQVMNLEVPVDINPDCLLKRVEITADATECIKIAMHNRPDIIINRLLSQFHKYNVKIARSRLSPQVNLTGALGAGAENYSTEPLSYGTDWFLGLEVKYSLGDHSVKSTLLHQDTIQTAGQSDSTKSDSYTMEFGVFDQEVLRLRGDYQAARIEYKRALEQFEKSKQTVIYEVKENYFNYKKAVLLIADHSNRVSLNVEQVKVTEAMHQVNEASTMDLIKGKIDLNKTQVSYFQSLADQHIAVSGLNRAIGIYRYFQ